MENHVIYLTFAKGELEPNEHLPNMYVSLGMMDYDGQNKQKVLDPFRRPGQYQRQLLGTGQPQNCVCEICASSQIKEYLKKI